MHGLEIEIVKYKEKKIIFLHMLSIGQIHCLYDTEVQHTAK